MFKYFMVFVAWQTKGVRTKMQYRYAATGRKHSNGKRQGGRKGKGKDRGRREEWKQNLCKQGREQGLKEVEWNRKNTKNQEICIGINSLW